MPLLVQAPNWKLPPLKGSSASPSLSQHPSFNQLKEPYMKGATVFFTGYLSEVDFMQQDRSEPRFYLSIVCILPQTDFIQMICEKVQSTSLYRKGNWQMKELFPHSLSPPPKCLPCHSVCCLSLCLACQVPLTVHLSPPTLSKK